jgi:predicted NBD/HSP70 family sugar kinase
MIPETGLATAETPAPADEPRLRGTNQAGMRAHNERLVLSLLRQHGTLTKTDVARITGLSAQTVSVIARALESDGLIRRGDPVRGRIGQPSVPLSLAPDGAFFLGLKLGRRSAELVLIDLVGEVRAAHRRIWPWPTPDAVLAFVDDALPAALAVLTPAERARVGGLGIAMPFQLWAWVDYIGAPQAEMDAWRTRDIQAEIAARYDLPVFLQNDATAACRAEHVFGTGERQRDFLYFYVGFFIGGGLVLNGRLYAGPTGNAAGVGPMPVPGPGGRMVRLLDIASLYTLASAVAAAGGDPGRLWDDPERWDVAPDLIESWVAGAAEGLAAAVMSAAALLEIEAVVIDGWMPAGLRARLTGATSAAFARLDPSGIAPPVFREGTVGAGARALGAAALPLAQRYLLDPTAG